MSTTPTVTTCWGFITPLSTNPRWADFRAWQRRELKKWTYAPAAISRKRLVLEKLAAGLVDSLAKPGDWQVAVPMTFPVYQEPMEEEAA